MSKRVSLYCYATGQLATARLPVPQAEVVAFGHPQQITRALKNVCERHPLGGFAAFVNLGSGHEWTSHGRNQVERLRQLLSAYAELEVVS